MKSFDSNLPRLLTVSAFALLCFCVGYLMPRPFPALGQTPHPMSSFVDDVPGGGHGSRGIAKVVRGKHVWSCAPQKSCVVAFAFRTAPKGAAAPKPFDCSGSANCFAFAGGGFTYSKEDPYTGQPVSGQTYQNVQITGMFQLQAK